VVNLGTLLTDMDWMARRPTMRRERSVWAVDDRVDVSFHSYNQVTLRDFLAALLEQPLTRHRERVRYSDNLPTPPRALGRAIKVTDLLLEVNAFLRGRRDLVVVAEAGDALFAGLDIRVEGHAAYLAQAYYASMGFGVPGAIGAQIGTGKRTLVLCGDGAFQMTGTELAQAPRHGTNPIVLLINNGGWGIFRPVSDRQDLLEIPPWPYANLAREWGGFGMRVSNVGELRQALVDAANQDRFALIEAMIEPGSLSPVTKKYIAASVRGR
jgi:indolepyruvate decarboxylase